LRIKALHQLLKIFIWCTFQITFGIFQHLEHFCHLRIIFNVTTKIFASFFIIAAVKFCFHRFCIKIIFMSFRYFLERSDISSCSCHSPFVLFHLSISFIFHVIIIIQNIKQILCHFRIQSNFFIYLIQQIVQFCSRGGGT